MPWSPGASRKTSRTCSPWLGATWQAREQPELRFRKYYEGSPLGPPFFFLAEDPGSARRYVGMAALFFARR